MPKIPPVPSATRTCVHWPPHWEWHPQDRPPLPVCGLTYSHLLNCINYMRDRVLALAKLGQPHRALYNEMILVALLIEKDRRNGTATNFREYIEEDPLFNKFTGVLA